jgi:hypothetical protein
MLLFVLIPVAWLTIATVVLAICRMAAQGDGIPGSTGAADPLEGYPSLDGYLLQAERAALRAPSAAHALLPAHRQPGRRRARPVAQHGGRLHKVGMHKVG